MEETMKKAVKGLLVLWILLIMIPVIVFMISGKQEEKNEQDSPSRRDQKLLDDLVTVKVFFKEKNKLEALPLSDYLIGVVASEMPADFSPEALKAQAVAARTDIIYRMERAANDEEFRKLHEGGDTCDDTAHCMAYLSESEAKAAWGDNWFSKYYGNIIKAVEETDAMVMLYDGEIINAVFHSTSAGHTESAKNVWGSDIEYLRGVPSEGEEISPRFETVEKFSKAEFLALIKEKFPDVSENTPQDELFKITSRSENGYVTEVTIMGNVITGEEARAMLSLRSAAFENGTDEDGAIVFTVKGYGHGVGMSQYGAEAMALCGKSYEEILKHYYSGITFAKVSKK